MRYRIICTVIADDMSLMTSGMKIQCIWHTVTGSEMDKGGISHEKVQSRNPWLRRDQPDLRYQKYVDAGNSPQSVLGELAMEIIVGSMDHDLKAQYPQLKEQYNTALDAAKLALTEPGNSYMVQMEATPGGWTGEDVESVKEAVAGAFDRIISGN